MPAEILAAPTSVNAPVTLKVRTEKSSSPSVEPSVTVTCQMAAVVVLEKNSPGLAAP